MRATTYRFLRQYLRPRPGAVRTREVVYRRDGEALPATVYSPAGQGETLPGWVLLHGLTCAGREHTALDRFARAVAAAGSVALVPEIPEWTRLRIAPHVTVPTIRAAVLALDAADETAPGRIGLMGFSFGATQALIAAADPRLRGHLAGVTAWGAYYDPYRTFRFGLTGEHELGDERYRVEPDPYARWIMAANYLTEMPEHRDADDVAHALHRLALESGGRGVPAWTVVREPIRARVRAQVAPARQPLFDLLAPASPRPVDDRDVARELARGLARAGTRTEPLIDPRQVLPRVRVPIVLAHARDDRLVPFTESLRIRRTLPSDHCAGCTITALFAHSGGTNPDLRALGVAGEAVRFVGLLRRMLALV